MFSQITMSYITIKDCYTILIVLYHSRYKENHTIACLCLGSIWIIVPYSQTQTLIVAAIELTTGSSSVEIGNKQLSELTPFSLSPVTIPDIWGHVTYLYGHPTSLNRDAPFDMKPFLTTGIISSYDDETGMFITNIPAFYGNSGGPVLFKNEEGDMMVIGIVQKLIHFCLDWRNRYEREAIRNDWQNSGYSICLEVNKIISFLEANVTQ